ncbi:MAG: hypothetical protein ACFE9M_12855 [Promethearchaeota archaeon]
MSYIKDQVMNRIKEELKKGLPSKRKILSYLLDLLNKGNYPSLSDFEFYDIVGETYNLILDYNLNLQMLFTPIYKALKKRIRKLYGKEKWLEMEQYLQEKYRIYHPERYGIIVQEREPPRTLSTKALYVVFTGVTVVGLLFIFYGLFVYLTSSPALGITFMILGVIILLFLFNTVRRGVSRCCDCLPSPYTCPC